MAHNVTTCPGSDLQDLQGLPPLLTIKMVAAVVGVHDRSVRRWLAEGRLGAVHAGGRVRIPRAALITFLEAGA